MSLHTPLPTTTVCDIAKDRAKFIPGIRPLADGMAVTGPAYTVQGPPGDNKDLTLALDSVPEGAVIVLDAGGGMERAVAGDIVVRAIRKAGAAGFVVNGCVRDRRDIIALGFPVFCIGTVTHASTKYGGGAIGRPIAINGVTVDPGDMIVADDNGVIAVDPAVWQDVVQGVPQKIENDHAKIARVEAGESLADINGLR